MQTDPISDLLTRIRNAARARHARVELPASKLKIEIARVLKEEGYISTYKIVDESKTRKALRLFLKYTPDKRSRDHRPAARFAPGQPALRRRERDPRRRGRPGHQHPDHAAGRDDRPRGAQRAHRRRSAVRGLVSEANDSNG